MIARCALGPLLALLVTGSIARADSAPQAAQMPLVVDPSGFGNPPSGEIPILFNDHTVYATPDVLKRGRVLAALVKDGQIYVPLRSMLEQMGARVTASADGKTITAEKNGASVSVTLGKREAVIDGMTRPLDVPPMLYHGVLLVPVRVLSEALGAYVEWIPDRRVVAIRYIAPTPEPSAVPTAEPSLAPSPAPTAVPTPIPTQRPYGGYIEAAYLEPKTYNEFAAGRWCPGSYTISGAYAFKDSPLALKVDYRQDDYVTSDNLIDAVGNHFTQFTTIDGGTAFTPVFAAKQSTLDGRLEYRIAAPQIYVGVGYIDTSNNYGYPHLNAVGGGVEMLPARRPGINFFGSAFYYPDASGNYTITAATSPNVGRNFRQEYNILKYDVGLELVFANFPLYVYGGFNGDQYSAKQNAPINQTHAGPYLGLGVKF